MTCLYPREIKNRIRPCGQCLKCRLKKSSEWAMRLMHENIYWKKSSFVTLTYDEDHLPENGSLYRDDLTKWIKRVRKALGERKIKYFAGGEYGDNFGRPHYHLIMFGVDEDDKDLLYDAWKKCLYERFDMGMVEYNSCRYVAQYIMKKQNGINAIAYYKDKEPEFLSSSQGLGKRYAIDNEENLKEDLCIRFQGVEMSIPRYYCKVLDIDLYEYTVEHDNERMKRWLYRVEKFGGKPELYKKESDLLAQNRYEAKQLEQQKNDRKKL